MDWLIAAGGYGLLALAAAFGGGVALGRRHRAERTDSFTRRGEPAAGTERPVGGRSGTVTDKQAREWLNFLNYDGTVQPDPEHGEDGEERKPSAGPRPVRGENGWRGETVPLSGGNEE